MTTPGPVSKNQVFQGDTSGGKDNPQVAPTASIEKFGHEGMRSRMYRMMTPRPDPLSQPGVGASSVAAAHGIGFGRGPGGRR